MSHVAEFQAEKSRAQMAIDSGETVEIDLPFDGMLCGHKFLIARSCQVTFLVNGYSPYRIVSGLMDGSLILWNLPGARYIQRTDDEENDAPSIARFTIDDED